MKIVAFIPVRGGSKGIPFKNVKPFCDRPLTAWCIDAAEHAETIDKVFVATDSFHVKSILFSMQNEKVEIIDVSKMDDLCMQERPMLEFAENADFDAIMLMQATTPYTRSVDIDNAVDMIYREKCDTVVSVSRQHRLLWGKTPEYAYPLNYNPQKRPRRQEWDGLLVENGAFFITSREAFLKSKCRISGKVALYEMPPYTYWEIDNETDWLIAEEIFRRRILNGKTHPCELS